MGLFTTPSGHPHLLSHAADAFGVDIGAPFRAALPLLAFEGATKRNRPALAPGDLVYCRVEGACRDLDPALTCMDAAGKVGGAGESCGGEWVSVGGRAHSTLRSAPHGPRHPALPTPRLAVSCPQASGFGPLKGGTLIEVSTSHARALLARPPAAVLAALGAALQFEAAVGLNGRVWIDAPRWVGGMR